MTHRKIIFPSQFFDRPTNKEKTMSDIYNVSPSDETIIVAPTEVHAIYGQTGDNRTEYVGMYIKDARLGELFIPLGLAAAAQVIANVAGILGNIDDLRTQWEHQNGSAQ